MPKEPKYPKGMTVRGALTVAMTVSMPLEVAYALNAEAEKAQVTPNTIAGNILFQHYRRVKAASSKGK